jgi:hypothetical protein
VGEREDAREITEAEAMRHPRRNEVFRDVGSERHAPDDADFIEIARVPFEPDAVLLLCSDGLSDLVPSAEIRRIVERHAGDPEAAVRDLIEAANRAGGKDNVSVVLVESASAAGIPAARPPFFARRAACFVYGFVLAGALAAGGYYRFLRPPIPPPPPRTLVVGPGQQISAISDALAQARPGDTVEVLAGEYTEQLRLKSGVVLRSRVAGGAILRTAPVEPSVAVLAEGVHNARFIGFRVLGDAKLATGVLLHNADLEMTDLEIAGPQTGIEFRGASRGVLRSSSVHDCGTAVVVAGSGEPFLSHNGFTNGKRPGLVVRDAARPVVVGNVFERPDMVVGADPEALAKFNFFLGRKGAR